MTGVLLTFWLPTIPENISRRLIGIYHLRGWTEFVLFAHYAYLFIVLYWAGISEILRFHMGSLAGRSLKPLAPTALNCRVSNYSKIVSLSLVMIMTGGLGATANWITLTARGFSIDPMSFIGAIAVIVAFSIFLIALVNLLITRTAEICRALAAAITPGLLSILPGVLFVYWPDGIEAHPGLRDLIVFPLNLIWHADVIARWGLVVATTQLVLAVGFIIVVGWSLERKD